MLPSSVWSLCKGPLCPNFWPPLKSDWRSRLRFASDPQNVIFRHFCNHFGHLWHQNTPNFTGNPMGRVPRPETAQNSQQRQTRFMFPHPHTGSPPIRPTPWIVPHPPGKVPRDNLPPLLTGKKGFTLSNVKAVLGRFGPRDRSHRIPCEHLRSLV